MIDALKPCPFCGRTPTVDYQGVVGGGWSIRCVCVHAPGLIDQRREVAIELWNTRWKRREKIWQIVGAIERLASRKVAMASNPEQDDGMGSYSEEEELFNALDEVIP